MVRLLRRTLEKNAVAYVGELKLPVPSMDNGLSAAKHPGIYV